MRSWSARRVADAAGATLLAEPASPGGPARAGIDSRGVSGGDLFVGLPGARSDGGAHAPQALAAGAWGVMVAGEHAPAAAGAAGAAAGGAVLVHDRPLEGLQALARAWRAEVGAAGARVVAITGSTGKTSTKDILAALLAPQLRTAASDANLNTEIGLPLAILAAPRDSEALVLEMAMRGPGQIAELTAIAQPDVGVVLNVGPAHLELLGSLEAIAEAKAELIDGLRPGAAAVVPAREPLLERHLRGDLRTVTFGEGGDVRVLQRQADGWLVIGHGSERMRLCPSFAQEHNLRNLLAAIAAARCLGLAPEGPLDVRFSGMRGQRLELAAGVVVIDDCYNANPMSMRAAIDDLLETASGRSVAVLGDMLELGPTAVDLHREVGRYAAARGVQLLVSVGPLGSEIAGAFTGEAHRVADADAAAELLQRLLRRGDTLLVKGSRGVRLERTVAALREWRGGPQPGGERAARAALAPGASGSGRR